MALQGKVWEIIITLFDENGDDVDDPVDALQPSDVVLKFRKPFASTFQTKSLDASNWRYLGGGYYSMIFNGSDTSDTGTFLWSLHGAATVEGSTLEGPTFGTLRGEFNIEAEPFYLKPAPPVCILYGSIANIGGQPGRPQLITFRPISVPSLQGSTLIQSETLQTSTDAAGNFSIALIRDMKVRIDCEQLGLKVVVRIPNTETVELSSIMPPIPPEV
jgi:hypothetical protein